MLPLLEEVMQDEESSVRDALASNLSPIIRKLVENTNDALMNELVQVIWKVSTVLLKDKDQKAHSFFLSLSSLTLSLSQS